MGWYIKYESGSFYVCSNALILEGEVVIDPNVGPSWDAKGIAQQVADACATNRKTLSIDRATLEVQIADLGDAVSSENDALARMRLIGEFITNKLSLEFASPESLEIAKFLVAEIDRVYPTTGPGTGSAQASPSPSSPPLTQASMNGGLVDQIVSSASTALQGQAPEVTRRYVTFFRNAAEEIFNDRMSLKEFEIQVMAEQERCEANEPLRKAIGKVWLDIVQVCRAQAEMKLADSRSQIERIVSTANRDMEVICSMVQNEWAGDISLRWDQGRLVVGRANSGDELTYDFQIDKPSRHDPMRGVMKEEEIAKAIATMACDPVMGQRQLLSLASSISARSGYTNDKDQIGSIERLLLDCIPSGMSSLRHSPVDLEARVSALTLDGSATLAQKNLAEIALNNVWLGRETFELRVDSPNEGGFTNVIVHTDSYGNATVRCQSASGAWIQLETSIEASVDEKKEMLKERLAAIEVSDTHVTTDLFVSDFWRVIASPEHRMDGSLRGITVGEGVKFSSVSKEASPVSGMDLTGLRIIKPREKLQDLILNYLHAPEFECDVRAIENVHIHHAVLSNGRFYGKTSMDLSLAGSNISGLDLGGFNVPLNVRRWNVRQPGAGTLDLSNCEMTGLESDMTREVQRDLNDFRDGILTSFKRRPLHTLHRIIWLGNRLTEDSYIALRSRWHRSSKIMGQVLVDGARGGDSVVIDENKRDAAIGLGTFLRQAARVRGLKITNNLGQSKRNYGVRLASPGALGQGAVIDPTSPPAQT